MDTLNTDLSAKPISIAAILWAIIAGSLTIHILVMVAGHTVLADWRWTGVAVHTSLEMSGTVTALFVAMFLLRYERFGRGTHFNVRIAAALICMGVLDGFHAVVAVGNTFVWLHSIATFAGGLMFAAIFIPTKWVTFNARFWPRMALIASMAIGLFSFIYPQFIPQMVEQHKFTTLAILLNVVGGLLLLMSAIQLIVTYNRSKNIDDLLFCLHCSLFAAAAIMFQQSTLWDTSWWGWHILRFLAYAIALWFVIRGEAKIMNELEQHRHHLTELVAQQTEKVQQSEALLKDAQRIAHLGSWRRDIKSGQAQWSDELYRICGFEPGAVYPSLKTIAKVLHADDKANFLQDFDVMLTTGKPVERECRIYHSNGQMRYLLISGIVNLDDKGQPNQVLGVALDITEQKAKEARIEHLANHDALTDLPGLRLCRERMENELSRAIRNMSMFAVMFIDLDGFKQVNDNLGHDIGDALLKRVALRLTTCLRNVDTVARIGGDEFLILQTDVKDESAVAIVASKLIEAIEAPYSLSGHKIEIAASIGIALFPVNGDTINLLMKQADKAMYRVKKNGKNNFEFA